MSVGRLKHLSPKHSGFFHIQRSVHFRRKNEFSGSAFVGRVLYVSAAKLESGASCHKFFQHVKVSYYIYRYYVYSQFIKLFIIIPFCHQSQRLKSFYLTPICILCSSSLITSTVIMLTTICEQLSCLV